jgi:hypothetical protein
MLSLPRHAQNTVTLAGVMLVVVIVLTMVVVLSLEATTGASNPYSGIFVYMVLPPFLLLGLLLIPIGIVRHWRRFKRLDSEVAVRWPSIDLNMPPHRRVFSVFIFGTLGFVLLSVIGSYHAYHHTESVTFCGETCHSVMKPEHVAYQNSAHARVACTACHVGTGAGWYAKSKLSGAYQVYAVAADIYPRPIPTPIENLRPAQETCEQCHWPERFFGAQQRQFNHYRYDEDNSPWPINMLIKTGGGDPKTGQTSGIHWHMNISVQVEYIARDERRQDIPWVRITDRRTNRVTVYEDQENPLTEDEMKAAVPRVMDCMDCHNRPSHKFFSPDFAVDHAILTGQIDPELPQIKRIATEAMSEEYETEDEALHSIANTILSFYLNEYPEIHDGRRDTVEQAVLAAQKQFSQTIFPEMKVRWSEYPDNIGHYLYPGCMRCHLGSHVSDDGRTITHDCNACHVILSQGSGDRLQIAHSQEGLEFLHPEDIGEAWREYGCYECHLGSQP